MKRLFFVLFMIHGMVQAQAPHFPATIFDSVFTPWFKPGEPGGAVLIVKDNEVVYQKAFGIADMKTKEPVSTKTLFNLGSISKTVVAYGVLQLAEKGKLSLEDDLFTYFPDFTDTAIAKKVKLYHLLTHTSGLPDSRKV